MLFVSLYVRSTVVHGQYDWGINRAINRYIENSMNRHMEPMRHTYNER